MVSDLYRVASRSVVAIAAILAMIWSAADSIGQATLPSQHPLPIPLDAEPEIVISTQAGPAQELATLDRLHWPLLRRDLQVNGAMACATANCHGGPRVGVSNPSARRGMEFQIWLESDPHALSWRTLCSDESVAMMERLGILEDGEIVDQAGFDNCLACHNSTKRFDETRSHANLSHTHRDANRVNTFLREGVGCAGCHGPSERWISTHFQSDWSPHIASADGFVQAGDLFVRARMCASCHVGDKDRDMNHDIIAAGHPALRYEFATFHAWQPKHWRDREADEANLYEAQLWLAGQIASVDASLALLQSRAEKTHTVSTWPEFAAYNCSSCHHNLSTENQRTPIDERRKSVALYSQWDDSGIRWLIQYRIENGDATELDDRIVASLDEVKSAMESGPYPDAQRVARAARQARSTLASWFDGDAGSEERRQFCSERLAGLVASAAGKANTYRSWESATQFYLAVVATRASWPDGRNGPMRETTDRMRQGLRYPEMIDISRFERRHGGPTATRFQTARWGMELGRWLGPIEPEMMADEPEIMVDDDRETTEQMRESLRQMIERINGQHARGVPDREGSDEPRRTDDPRPDGESLNLQPPAPSREQLLDQLRQLRQSREQEIPDRQP